jgi:thioredoxin-related protein
MTLCDFKIRSLPVLLLLISAVGCDQSSTGSTATEVKKTILKESKIHWFDGSVEEGFALAKAENKPVYLYWGAVWCPPCQEIKHTVFKSKQFIAQTELFVPIYLDGDTDRAQSWGEKFGVKGYPTMIVFNPEGEEVTRIPGGIDISQYNSVLELSLNQMRPTSMLVELALAKSRQLQPKDYMQLAYYSWGQDSGSLPEGTPASFFLELADSSPSQEASARLFMVYLIQLSEEYEKAKESAEPLSTPLSVPLSAPGEYERLVTILDSPEMTLICWDSLGYYAEEITGLPIFSEEELASLKKKWSEQFLALRHQPSLSTAEQLTGWLPTLSLHYMNDEDAVLPVDVLEDLRADLRAADEKTTNSFARQSVVSQMNYLYQSAKLYDEARDLLLAELDKSESPYYFMSSLSSLAEKTENIEEALEWRRQSYESSGGAATRFQWGANYVRTIIRLTPENHDLIMATSLALFDEFQAEEEVFAGRNFRVLRSLNKQLVNWQEEQSEKALVDTFQLRLSTMCEHQMANSIERENCESLIEQVST